MPNNVRELKRNIKQAVSSAGTRGTDPGVKAMYQQAAAFVMLKNLMINTPVLKGTLAGGWKLVLRGVGSGGRITKNTTGKISAVNAEKIDKITGRSTINIINTVPYAAAVNNGTRFVAARSFVELSLTQSLIELNKLSRG